MGPRSFKSHAKVLVWRVINVYRVSSAVSTKERHWKIRIVCPGPFNVNKQTVDYQLYKIILPCKTTLKLVEVAFTLLLRDKGTA